MSTPSTPAKPRPRKPAEPKVLECVQARRFEIVDRWGDVRAIIGVVESANQPGIALFDKSGKERIAIGFSATNDAIVQVRDRWGNIEASISSEAAPEEVL